MAIQRSIGIPCRPVLASDESAHARERKRCPGFVTIGLHQIFDGCDVLPVGSYIMTNRVGAQSSTHSSEAYATAAPRYLLTVPANGTTVGAAAEIRVC